MPLWAAAVNTLATVIRAPFYLVSGATLVVRRPSALIGYAAPLLVLLVTFWLQFSVSNRGAFTSMLLVVAGLTAIPERPSRRLAVVLSAAVILQALLTWLWPLPDVAVEQWLDALCKGSHSLFCSVTGVS